jgi:hypothetical protein
MHFFSELTKTTTDCRQDCVYKKGLSLIVCACFVDRCLSFCPISCVHCVVCPSTICGFWLNLWYLQTLQDRVTRTQLKTGGELKCSGRVHSSCSIGGTPCVNLVTNPKERKGPEIVYKWNISEVICRVSDGFFLLFMNLMHNKLICTLYMYIVWHILAFLKIE